MPPNEHILPNMQWHGNSPVAPMNTGCIETTKKFLFLQIWIPAFHRALVLMFFRQRGGKAVAPQLVQLWLVWR
jgi:hypothetical protein